MGRLAAACLAVMALGCGRQEPIAKYRVGSQPAAEPRASETSGEPSRMLGAIVPHGAQTWFFKLTGPPERVATVADDFQAVVRSLHFEGDTPQWRLPPTWEPLPGKGMRFATLEIRTKNAPPLEVSVTMLGREPGGDDADYALSNVNRWRGQLGLPSLSNEQLAAETKSLALADGAATLVDITGHSQGDGMGRPPFARGPFSGGPFSGGGAVEAPAASGDGTAAGGGESNIVYELPEGWARAPGDAFSKLAFVVADGSKTAKITVTELAGPADLRANVNRWRNQVGLEPTTADELESNRRPATVGSLQGSYVELIGPVETVLGVIARARDKTWFVKLKGPNALAAGEKTHFQAFVRSIKFRGAEEAGHGK